VLRLRFRASPVEDDGGLGTPLASSVVAPAADADRQWLPPVFVVNAPCQVLAPLPGDAVILRLTAAPRSCSPVLSATSQDSAIA
jgi:hypothetical protein